MVLYFKYRIGGKKLKIQNQIRQSAYKADGFIKKYQKLIKDTVIPYQYSVLNDKARGAEKSHVVKNFENAARALNGEEAGDGFYGQVFQDSDAAKWIEAAAYSLVNFPDKKLEKLCDGLIDKIVAAQDKDGYLDTYFTIKDRDKRWTNLLEAHELYCAGHMMEAACAYYEATGKNKLLKTMLINAEHIYKVFITDGHEGFPGHPEIELALLKMYRLTGNKHCFELAEHFINKRGTDPDYYKKEAQNRGWTVWGNNANDNDYQQSGVPVRDMTDAVGHAVRAVYLFTAMADLSSQTNDKKLFDACKRLWQSITEKRMYITGGIGSTVHGEAFSVDYDLPGDTAYAETCASVGLMFFASRMLEYEIDSKYADVMEQAFYNTVLAGIQLDGKRFFYVNPLEVVPGISGVASAYRHALTQRPGWYACACCPPNAARLISSFGKYAYGENDDTAFCHMFASGEVNFKNGVSLVCKTDYPYGFTVQYEVKKGGALSIRIPGWSKSFGLSVNEKNTYVKKHNGYVFLNVSDGDCVTLSLDLEPRFVWASSKVARLTGKVCLLRGPLVYCFEGVDNGGDVLSLALKRGGEVKAFKSDDEILKDTVKLSVKAVRRKTADSLYSDTPPNETDTFAIAVPYYTWGNRGENQMRVWLDDIK